ncbi:MAG: hypothetical protein EBX52_05590 [Proteobacteria bacterium]|nr:hypothetical protein [Pseudomonadota bacterium]
MTTDYAANPGFTVGTRLGFGPRVFIKSKNPIFPFVLQLALFFSLGLIPPPALAKGYTNAENPRWEPLGASATNF